MQVESNETPGHNILESGLTHVQLNCRISLAGSFAHLNKIKKYHPYGMIDMADPFQGVRCCYTLKYLAQAINQVYVVGK